MIRSHGCLDSGPFKNYIRKEVDGKGKGKVCERTRIL